jgi:hypothetical protein
MPQYVVATPACPPQVIRAGIKITPAFWHGCIARAAGVISRNGPISATIFAEFAAHPVGTTFMQQTLE